MPVGEIKSVDLENGRAVVTMSIRQKYAELIKRDATMLLRPKTGLKDMIVELDPGTRAAGRDEGYTVPVPDTPRTSTWTRSAPPSTATRATT